jgi:glycosyltransferase involved in cell wall biosynthesis
MRQTAVYGRGINSRDTSVVQLGVDTRKYKPNLGSRYAYDAFEIPLDRKIVFYSGHMQERKGVRVIISAAVELVNKRNRNDVHFLLVGNKRGEEQQYFDLYRDTVAEKYITFGGYRDDIPEILPACYIGTIASTGWDSFTMSSVEMASAGVPLIVSNLQGLVETVEDGDTGYLFDAGDHLELANKIEYLLEHQNIQKRLSENSRTRIEKGFSIDTQINKLVSAISRL